MFYFVHDEFEKYIEEMEKLASNVNQAIKEFLMEQANKCVDRIRIDTPVDTGYLKSNWIVTNYQRYKDLYSVDIENDAPYASFVEDGWSTTAKGVTSRFVPGYWLGEHFVYDPNAKTGMTLKHKEYKGKHMARINVIKTQYHLNAEYKKFMQKFFEGQNLGGLGSHEG